MPGGGRHVDVLEADGDVADDPEAGQAQDQLSDGVLDLAHDPAAALRGAAYLLLLEGSPFGVGVYIGSFREHRRTRLQEGVHDQHPGQGHGFSPSCPATGTRASRGGSSAL